MQARIVSAPGDMAVGDLSELIASAPNSEVFIVDENQALIGMATMSELPQGPAGKQGLTAADIARPCSTVVVVDDHVAEVVEEMQAEEETRLPVVANRKSRQLLGLVREADLLRAINRVLLDDHRDER